MHRPIILAIVEYARPSSIFRVSISREALQPIFQQMDCFAVVPFCIGGASRLEEGSLDACV